MKILQMVCAAAITIVLGACGGGGGSAGKPMGNSANATSDTSASPKGTITVAVLDSAGASVAKVTFAGQTLQATYLDTLGAPIKGARVAFAVTSGTGVVLVGD